MKLIWEVLICCDLSWCKITSFKILSSLGRLLEERKNKKLISCCSKRQPNFCKAFKIILNILPTRQSCPSCYTFQASVYGNWGPFMLFLLRFGSRGYYKQKLQPDASKISIDSTCKTVYWFQLIAGLLESISQIDKENELLIF